MDLFSGAPVIVLGRETESHVCVHRFPIKKWVDMYGFGGSFHLYNKRPTDTSSYPVVITYDNDFVYWTPNETDLAYRGEGEVQLDYVFGIIGQSGYKKACSEVFKTRIDRSIEPGGESPQPYQPWVSQIEGYADRAEAASESAAGSASTAYTQAVAASESATDAEDFKNQAAAIMHQATFEIDIETAELVVNYPTPYEGATFSISDDGYLEVTTT